MSNQVVGSVYLQIIEKVIAASQNDFEEFGVDQSTLDEMKQGWQEKLSALKIAAFPWDPQPEPPRQPPTVPSMKNDAVAPPPQSAPQDHVNFPSVGIKSERGYDAPMSSYPQVPVNGYNSSGYNGELAQQRAHALVAQRLNQGQHSTPQHQHPHQQHPGQVPMHNQQRMMPGQAQQQQQRPPQQMQQRPQQGHVYQSQTDGPGDAMEDWIAFKAAREASGVDQLEGRIAADSLMRAHLDALTVRQDSGLMMPLSEMPKGQKRKTITRILQAQEAERSLSGTSSLPGPTGFDGVNEEVKEEDPDDAINSDLDDPDDDLDGADGSDDETTDYMLCTYDKVQRVKNKWKCTLKDGILCTNKKEYLFHKATAELEF